jgi:spermidine/putrescine ABC transporter ATP-binding subunit
MASAAPLSVEFRAVEKRFGTFTAVHATNLGVKPGEFLTLLGPSGSGKTTLLNIVAGYVPPDAGSVWIGERDVTSAPARHRNIGMVFQSYALFPHLSVFENVAYGLRVRGVPASEIGRRVEAALAMVQLAGLGARSVPALSGGQQQRVALARALIIEPDVLLMDEPLGALDRQLRKHVQLEIRRLHRELGRTTLYVTHDQEEALVMSDRIGVMSAGRIEQIGTPRELYERPANAFVAGFLGESNLLEGAVIERRSGRVLLSLPELGATVAGLAETGAIHVGERAAALLRPEVLRIDVAGDDGLAARVAEIVFLGELIALRLVLRNGKELWCRRIATGAWPNEGDDVRVGWRAEDVLVLPLAKQSAREMAHVDET